MTALSPALDAALSADRVTVFAALCMTVGEDTLRLLDGSGEISIGGHLYGGEDPTYGVWGSVDAFEDGSGDEAPGLAVTMQPASDAALLALSSPSIQGEAVQMMIGAVDRATGLVIGEPLVLFDGEVDTAKHLFGVGEAEVELECVGGMERLFFNDEGLTLSASFHQQVWPGELGFAHVTGVRDTIYWGANTPTRQVYAGAPWMPVAVVR